MTNDHMCMVTYRHVWPIVSNCHAVFRDFAARDMPNGMRNGTERKKPKRKSRDWHLGVTAFVVTPAGGGRRLTHDEIRRLYPDAAISTPPQARFETPNAPAPEAIRSSTPKVSWPSPRLAEASTGTPEERRWYVSKRQMLRDAAAKVCK